MRRVALKQASDIKDVEIPKHWADLPDSTDPKADLVWAYNNQRHIKKRSGKDSVIYWGRCTDPPGNGSFSKLVLADVSFTKFQEMFDKATGFISEGDSESVKHERKSIAEIRAVLKKFVGQE
jgi:hypothetical protein